MLFFPKKTAPIRQQQQPDAQSTQTGEITFSKLSAGLFSPFTTGSQIIHTFSDNRNPQRQTVGSIERIDYKPDRIDIVCSQIAVRTKSTDHGKSPQWGKWHVSRSMMDCFVCIDPSEIPTATLSISSKRLSLYAMIERRWDFLTREDKGQIHLAGL